MLYLQITISESFIEIEKSSKLANRQTDWDLYTRNSYKKIILQVPIKNQNQLYIQKHSLY